MICYANDILIYGKSEAEIDKLIKRLKNEISPSTKKERQRGSLV